MIAEVCFTCTQHLPTAALTDAPADGLRRIWCVDTEYESALAVPLAPAGVEVWRRPFSRGGNLNGWPCVQGMAAVFAELVADGASLVIKRDSDTRRLGDPVRQTPSPGFAARGVRKAGVEPWRAFGALYSLTPQAVADLLAAALAKEYPVTPREDDFVSWTLRGRIEVLPPGRGAFVRNAGRHLEHDALWENLGNRWEPDHPSRPVGALSPPMRRTSAPPGAIYGVPARRGASDTRARA